MAHRGASPWGLSWRPEVWDNLVHCIRNHLQNKMHILVSLHMGIMGFYIAIFATTELSHCFILSTCMYAECWTCGNSLLTCHFVSVSPALYTRSQSNPWFAGLFTNLFLQQLWRVLPFIGLVSGRGPKRELGAWLSKDGVWFSCFVCL